jgi:oxygen-independent coproporphyrinogen-3 oxidase
VPITDRGQSGWVEEAVVTETLRQTEKFLEALDIRRLDTIYVGGGTPSCLPRRELERLLGALEGFSPDEWTVEANPESLDREFLEICEGHGVTRLSLGFQSNSDALLDLLGRPGRRADNLRAMSLMDGRWRGETSVDLLAGVPGQSAGDVEADVSLIADAGIGHVSLYSLTVEPDTELERMIGAGEAALDEETSEELWLHGKRSLENAGYENYEISNFALPGRRCRHNMRYWRLEPYLGAGPGAVSTVTPNAARAVGAPLTRPESAPVARLSNPRGIDAFLGGEAQCWNVEVESVGCVDFLIETLMVGLRTSEGIQRGAFVRRFGGDFDSFFPGLWESWTKEGLASASADFLGLTERGRLLLNTLLASVREKTASPGFTPPRVHWP